MNASNHLSAALLMTSLLTAGCDLAVYPTTSDYVAQEAARASVDLGVEAMPRDADVVEVELTVDSVALHRAHDDRWVLLSGDETPVTLIAEPRSGAIADVPMRMQSYDRISFGLTRVRVATADGWHEASFDADEIDVEGDFVVDTDVTVALAFDLDAGLSGNPRSGFTFEPLVAASIEHRR